MSFIDKTSMEPAFFTADDGARLYLGDEWAQTVARIEAGRSDPNSAKTPVLMLHSLFFSGAMFDPVRALLPATLPVLTPDFRNQGRSEAGTILPSINQLADDTITLIERAIGSPVNIVGSSMGGYVALRIAEIRPDLVKTCVLSCCTAHAERQPERFAALEARIREEGTAQMGNTLLQTMFGERFTNENNALCQGWRRHFEGLHLSRDSAQVADAVHGVFARQSFEPILPGLTMPLLLFSGELDRAKRPSDMAFIAERVAGSKHVVVADAGHTPPVECPAVFAEETMRFWESDQVDSIPKSVQTHSHQER